MSAIRPIRRDVANEDDEPDQALDRVGHEISRATSSANVGRKSGTGEETDGEAEAQHHRHRDRALAELDVLPSAAIAAERMSIRVPMTRVSYSTNMPRSNGILMSRRSADRASGNGSDIVRISPDGGRTLIAPSCGPASSRPR